MSAAERFHGVGAPAFGGSAAAELANELANELATQLGNEAASVGVHP
jgi:hypothetical protein